MRTETAPCTPRPDSSVLARAQALGVKVHDDKGNPRSSADIFDELVVLLNKATTTSVETKAQAEAAPTPAACGMNGPRPFAVMRQTHESFRVSSITITALLEEGKQDEAKAELKELFRAIDVHMIMEQGHDGTKMGVFNLLALKHKEAFGVDEFTHEHDDDKAIRDQVEAEGSLDSFRSTWAAFDKFHEDHLKHEEDVMMPLTVKTGDSLQERCDLVNHYCVEEAFAIGAGEEYKWFVGWNVEQLFKGRGKGPTKAYLVALRHTSTPEQYAFVLPAIKANLPAEMYDELKEKFELEGPGVARRWETTEWSRHTPQ